MVFYKNKYLLVNIVLLKIKDEIVTFFEKSFEFNYIELLLSCQTGDGSLKFLNKYLKKDLKNQ